jgi:hypothetical protein
MKIDLDDSDIGMIMHLIESEKDRLPHSPIGDIVREKLTELRTKILEAKTKGGD